MQVVVVERVGQAPGQQLVEDHAQRIDVGGGTDRAAGDLFGRGVFRA